MDRPLSCLLAKDVPFDFINECLKSFNTSRYPALCCGIYGLMHVIHYRKMIDVYFQIIWKWCGDDDLTLLLYWVLKIQQNWKWYVMFAWYLNNIDNNS